MDQHATDDTGLLGELSCLLICVGMVWMMIPGTVAITDGCLCVKWAGRSVSCVTSVYCVIISETKDIRTKPHAVGSLSPLPSPRSMVMAEQNRAWQNARTMRLNRSAALEA